MTTTTQVHRFPRLLGLTQSIQEYKANRNIDQLHQIQRRVINSWIVSNGYFCGRRFSDHQLTKFVRCDISLIHSMIKENFLSSKIWDKNKSEDTINSLLGQSLIWAIEDRMDSSQQLNLLLNSQGNKYKPFLSETINTAIKNKQSTSKGMLEVLRSVNGGGTVNIFNQNTATNNVEGDNLITIEKALNIISEKSQELKLETKTTKLIEANYEVEGLPSVLAREQGDADLSKELVNISQTELNQITSDYISSKKIANEEHHAIRREIAENIDPEEIDPEFDIY